MVCQKNCCVPHFLPHIPHPLALFLSPLVFPHPGPPLKTQPFPPPLNLILPSPRRASCSDRLSLLDSYHHLSLPSPQTTGSVSLGSLRPFFLLLTTSSRRAGLRCRLPSSPFALHSAGQWKVLEKVVEEDGKRGTRFGSRGSLLPWWGCRVLERQASPLPLSFPSHSSDQGPGRLRRVPGAAQGPCGAADTVLQRDQQTAAQDPLR